MEDRDKVIVEIKSLAELGALHKKQLLTDLRLWADDWPINFNEELIKDGITRVVNERRKRPWHASFRFAKPAILSYFGNREAVMTKATISSDGQITIPRAVRDRLDLKPGTELAIEVQGETSS